MKKPIAYGAYQKLADAYAAMIETKPHNAYYERPATRSLVGNVRNKRILDAGCGSGINTEWLLNQGAEVVGIDVSDKLLEHAKKRNGNHAVFYQADLEKPLSFLSDKFFDGIFSALTITYVEDLTSLFAEFKRVLKKSGWFVFSTEHPFSAYNFFKIENYFKTRLVMSEWIGFGKKVKMRGFYHSLGCVSEALSKNGFVIEKILEPKPTREFKDINLQEYKRLMKFPMFICFRINNR